MKRLPVILMLAAFLVTSGCSQQRSPVAGQGLPGSTIWTFATYRKALLAGTSHGLYRSNDGGVTWSPFATQLADVDAVRSIASVGDMLIAGTFDSGVYRSMDGGETWVAPEKPPTDPHIHALAMSGPVLLAGTAVGVFRSDDAGVTWTRSWPDTAPNVVIVGFAVAGPTTLASTFGGVYRSVDRGVTWMGPFKLPVRESWSGSVEGIAYSGRSVFAGSADGVYRSLDDGITWSAVPVQPGNGDRDAAAISSVAGNGSSVLVATEDGVYRSSDLGKSWQPFGLQGRWTGPVFVNGADLLAGTTRQSGQDSLVAARERSGLLFDVWRYPL